MTARYLLKVTDTGAARLEKWLGGRMQLVPFLDTDDPLADLRYGDDAPEELRGSVPDYNRAEADRRLARIKPVEVTGLDAITDDEYEVIGQRLRTSGPLYHAGGPS